MSQYESDVLTHARICLVCHSADQPLLQNCPKCHCVAYCSEACRQEDSGLHQTVCQDFVNCITDYKFSVTKGGVMIGNVVFDNFVFRGQVEMLFASTCNRKEEEIERF